MRTTDIDSIYKEQILKNAPKDFKSWISQNSKDQNLAKDAAAASLASEKFTSATYGTDGDELYSDGLISSGYADYLKSRAASEDYERKKLANDSIKIAGDGAKEDYSDYMKKYNAAQDKIQESYILDIVERGLLDIEEAYKIALISGLSKERALYSAAKGVAASKKEVIEKAISYASKHGYTSYGAKKYALGLGLDDASASRVAEGVSGLTKEDIDRYSSMSADEYLESLKSGS